MKLSLKQLATNLAFYIGVPAASLWMILAVWYSNIPGDLLRNASAVFLGIALISVMVFAKSRKHAISIVLGLLVLVYCGWALIPPSNDRIWDPSAERLTTAGFSENADRFTIGNVRNFEYRSLEDFDTRYYDKVVNLEQVTGVDFIVSYWGNASIAHTFLSFGFDDGSQLAVSIEIRPEVGESYHPIAGLFKQYELIYVFGDERDLIRLRTNYRNEETYLYRSTASPSQARNLLVDLLDRANQLAREPDFYGTIRQNCTTSLVEHINKVLVDDIPFSGRLLLNGYSDKLAYSRGNIRQDLPFEELKKACYISGIARSLDDDPEFSKKLRAHIKKELEARK